MALSGSASGLIVGLALAASSTVLAAEPRLPVGKGVEQGDAIDEAESSGAVVRIQVDYVAHEGCPDRARFLEQIRQRAEHVAFVARANPAARYRVSVVRENEGSRGQLHMKESVESRRVEARDCESVIEALALVIAISVEQTATEKNRQPDEPPPRRPGEEEPLAQGSWETPSPVQRLSEAFRFACGLSAITSAGMAPGPMLGASAVVQMDTAPRPRWLRPTVRLSASWQSTGGMNVGSGTARFTLLHGRVEGCPLGWGEITSVHLRTCLVVELGALRAEGLPGAQLATVLRATDFFGAVGFGVNLGVPLVGPLSFEIGLRLLAPLTRPTYIFEDPREVVHDPWLVSPSAAAGLAMRLP